MLASGDRGAVQDIAYGTLRHFGRLRALLDHLARKPVADAAVRGLLLVALYQLEFTRAKPFVVVDNAVQATEQLGFGVAKGLTNAILRNFLRRRAAALAAADALPEARYGHPAWWIEKLHEQYPEHWLPIFEVSNTPPPMTLRVNLRRNSIDGCLEALSAEGIDATHLGGAAITLSRAVPVDCLPGFPAGKLSIQDWSAQHAAVLLELADGMHVLDACSAPGGKTGHILEIADVDLLALDTNAGRLKRVEDNLDRLGLHARLVHADATDLTAWWDGRQFDRVLVDAPCSGSGVVRRHPDIKWVRRAADIPAFAATQDRLLDALWQVLRVGGKLCYATCSVFREENQQRITAFLSRRGDAARLKISLPSARDGQLIPESLHDGFFYAVLEKCES